MADSIIEFSLSEGSWQLPFDATDWDFPAFYADSNVPAELARFIADGGDHQDLDFGLNQVQLKGPELSFVWEIGTVGEMKIFFNPENQPIDDPGRFPQQVVVESPARFVQIIDGTRRIYHVEGSIERQDGGVVALLVDGRRYRDLSDSFHVDVTASSIAFLFEGLTGLNGVKVEYSLVPFP